MPRPWADPSSPLGRDYAACRALIRQGSRSFHAASLLLPKDVRVPACAIYAFCRCSDDAVDGPDARRDAVADLIDRLDNAYAGTPRDHFADRAFADTVARFGIPKALPAALLEGLDWDARGRRFSTLSDVFAYSARVAGAVGAMMTVLMGVRDRDTLARACDLGVAMQLTNIARDVGEDARNGRLYLPLVWLDEAGVDAAAFLAAPRHDPRIAALTMRLLGEAEALYDRACGGIAGLPIGARPAIHAARIIYREIGREVMRNGADSVSRRAIVPDSRKVTLLASAVLAAALSGSGRPYPPLAETRFLVDAVPHAATPAALGIGPLAFARGVDRRVGWVINLFGELAERERREA